MDIGEEIKRFRVEPIPLREEPGEPAEAPAKETEKEAA